MDMINRDMLPDKDLDAILFGWYYVNADNEFLLLDNIFKIDDDVDDYKVHYKYNDLYEFKNKSSMDIILVIIDSNYRIRFFNQNYEEIDKNFINIKEW